MGHMEFSPLFCDLDCFQAVKCKKKILRISRRYIDVSNLR